MVASQPEGSTMTRTQGHGTAGQYNSTLAANCILSYTIRRGTENCSTAGNRGRLGHDRNARATGRRRSVPVQTSRGSDSSQQSAKEPQMKRLKACCCGAAEALEKSPVPTQARPGIRSRGVLAVSFGGGLCCTTKSQVIRPSFRCSLCGLETA